MYCQARFGTMNIESLTRTDAALRQKLVDKWQALTIKKKIISFVGAVVLIITLSLLFNIWVVKFSLMDFNSILEDNARSSELMVALENEIELFATYMKTQNEEDERLLKDAMERTDRAVHNLPSQYKDIGESRYAKTWSIQNSYETYCEKRDEFLSLHEGSEGYIVKLYRVYDMQNYLQEYAEELVTDTLEAGSNEYRQKISGLIVLPFAVIAAAFILLFTMINLARLLNRAIIIPIMALVQASQNIANNNFFISDVVVQSRDEMGELVNAFNKMKYATGQYITALEEKAKMEDLLHREELQRLEVEKRLESTNFELLKNQLNPHFLFNTLNVIGGMANLEGAETTEKMIRALSSLFRYNLKTSGSQTLLSQEIRIVKDYMYLQQMRFGSRIDFNIECELDTEKYMVPTSSFQPLVENAIIHGLAQKEEGGRIVIRIWEKQQKLMVTITDNGVGMSEEKLKKLQNAFEMNDGTQFGIGLGNIYRRIKGMYQEGRMEIYSKEGEGTTILLIIPQDEEKE